MLTLEKTAKTLTLLSLKVSFSAFLPPSLLFTHHEKHYEKHYEKLLHNLRLTFILPDSTGNQRKAHKPNSKPKLDAVLHLKKEVEENGGESEDGGSGKDATTKEELWARLDELEKLEELQDEQDR